MFVLSFHIYAHTYYEACSQRHYRIFELIANDDTQRATLLSSTDCKSFT